MTHAIEFGSKPAADAAREEYETHLCSQDDRRLKTVRFSSDTPESVLSRVRAHADADRHDADQRSTTASLSEATRERIKELDGFDNDTATVFNWESAKGVFAREGLTDQFRDHIGSLTDYDDPIEGAEIVVDRITATGDVSGGARDHGEEDERAKRKAVAAAERELSEGCDHARGHCRMGDPEACDHLRDACGFDEEEIETMLADEPADDGDEITGKHAGALSRSWKGYKGGIAALDQLLDRIEGEWDHAQQAARVINRVREQHGQDPLDFEELEERQARLVDLQRRAAADCYECHADHRDHADDRGRGRIDEGGAA